MKPYIPDILRENPVPALFLLGVWLVPGLVNLLLAQLV